MQSALFETTTEGHPVGTQGEQPEQEITAPVAEPPAARPYLGEGGPLIAEWERLRDAADAERRRHRKLPLRDVWALSKAHTLSYRRLSKAVVTARRFREAHADELEQAYATREAEPGPAR